MLRRGRSHGPSEPYPANSSSQASTNKIEEWTRRSTHEDDQLQPLAEVGKGSFKSSKIKLCDIPGKGKGFIAVQGIKAHEMIIREEATLCYDAAGTYYEDVKSVHAAFAQLDEGSKQHVLELTDLFMFGGRKTVEGIIFTNYTKGEFSSTWQLFRLYSRLNHSCVPNARWFACPGEPGQISETVQVFTIRAVAKGEEVCTDYGYDGDADSWPFQCLCTKCTETHEQLQAEWLQGSANKSMK